MIKTPLCEMLGIQFPIIQAGMGVYRGLVTSPELVAAVSNAGGMGCLGGTGLEPNELREAIRKVRTLTNKPFGVNLLIPAKLSTREGSRDDIRQDIENNYPQHWALVRGLFEKFGIPDQKIDKEYSLTIEYTNAQSEVVFDEKAPLFVIGLGDPANLMGRARAAGTKVAGLAGSVNNAKRQLAAGVDFIIAQGSEAGGHVGTISTFPLVPQVVDAVHPVPVVAAGGIADGRGIVAALALGAQGVWCGTAFLFANEANLHSVHRAQIESGRSEDFVTSRIFTGKPARTYHNEIHELWAASGIDPLPMPHQKVLMEDFLNAARKAGRLDLVNNPAGQIAGMVKKSKPAAEIVQYMVSDAQRVLRRCASMLD
jgi:nitronate monooxygenase